MITTHPNRVNKRKNKRGSSCALCKPWKHKWEKRLKPQERDSYFND